jgi:hypothetical protein
VAHARLIIFGRRLSGKHITWRGVKRWLCKACEVQIARDELGMQPGVIICHVGQPLLAVPLDPSRTQKDSQEWPSYLNSDRRQIDPVHLAVLN